MGEEEINVGFGVLGEAVPIQDVKLVDVVASAADAIETEDQRIARLRALALATVAKETDAELLAKFIAEEKLRLREKLLPQDLSGVPAEYDKVEIYESQDPKEQQYVPLGINGYTIKAPRGREIILPHAYVTECLEHAVMTTVTQAVDGLVLRDRRRFPHQFKGKATKEEYKTFMDGDRKKQAADEAARL